MRIRGKKRFSLYSMYLTFVDNKMKIVLCKFSNRTLFFIRQESEERERDGSIRRVGKMIDNRMNGERGSIWRVNNETLGEGKRTELVRLSRAITSSQKFQNL